MSTQQVQQLRRFNSMERRPRMLKDFLSENLNSCSSGGFKSFPRKPNNNNNNTMHSLIEMELKSPPPPPSSSSSSNSPFQTLMNTIRSISLFNSMRKSSPSMLSLPRSLSRKISSSSRRRNRRTNKVCNEINIRTVKIKDIIRWKSFCDINVEPSLPPTLTPLNFMIGSTTTTATTTTISATATTNSRSSGSSWSECESDFFNSSWEEAQNDNVGDGKKFLLSPLVVGMDSSGATEVLTCQEEQNSPVSVLQVGEDEFSLFDQSLANIERRKQKFIQTVQKLESLAKFDLANLDQCLSLDGNSSYHEEYEYEDEDDDNDIEEQDWIEEKAKQLLHSVKAKSSSSTHGCRDYLDTLLLDFFREELIGRRNQDKNGDEDFELETLRIAEDWINGLFAFDAGHVNKDDYIKDMDRRDQWKRFEEDQEEIAFEIETAILHNLVADLLDLEG